MNENKWTLDYKYFSSPLEAEQYFKSTQCDSDITYLSGRVLDLYEASKSESRFKVMGGPDSTESEQLADYTDSEVSRLISLRDYFRNIAPNPGYIWVLNASDNPYRAYQIIDKSNLNTEHPVFIQFLEGRILDTDDLNDAFNVWKNSLDGGITALFKAAYYFKLKDLIPNSAKLLEEI